MFRWYRVKNILVTLFYIKKWVATTNTFSQCRFSKWKKHEYLLRHIEFPRARLTSHERNSNLQIHTWFHTVMILRNTLCRNWLFFFIARSRTFVGGYSKKIGLQNYANGNGSKWNEIHSSCARFDFPGLIFFSTFNARLFPSKNPYSATRNRKFAYSFSKAIVLCTLCGMDEWQKEEGLKKKEEG